MHIVRFFVDMNQNQQQQQQLYLYVRHILTSYVPLMRDAWLFQYLFRYTTITWYRGHSVCL